MRSLAKDRVERYQTAADFRGDLEIALSGKVPDRGPVADDFNSTLFGVNPNSSAASEATLRRLADDTDDRVPRTQTRPPVAWLWGGIALLVVIIVAAAFWIVNLAPTTIVGDNVAVEVPDIVGQTYEEGGNKLLELGLVPVKIDVPNEDEPIGHDPRRSTPRPARSSVPTRRCGSRSRPARRASPSSASRSRPSSRRKTSSPA